MPKRNSKECMSPQYNTKDVNVSNNECNGWPSQEMCNFPSKKRANSATILEDEIDMFLQLLDEDAVIQAFFKKDMCSQLADKYLLAMVFTYFKRAQYAQQEFTRYNFFVALFLAHDIEEDDEDMKLELYIWALGLEWQLHYKEMLTSRDVLWKIIGYRGIVSTACCEEVMSLRPNHPVWQRNRAKHHAGANCSYGTSSKPVCCNYCELKTAREINDSGIFESSDDTDRINSDSFKVSGSPQSPYDVCELFVNESALRMATSLEDSLVSEIHNHIQASEEMSPHMTTKNVTINNKELELAFYCYFYKNDAL